MFSALHNPRYRRYWFGNLAAVSGQQMLFVAQGWLVYDLTQSPLALGYTGLVAAIPAIVLNLAGGVMADRVDARRMIMATQSCTAALIASLATLTALGVVEVWHVLVVAFCSGALQAFNNPARQSIFPQLIERKDLMNAVSLNSMIWQGTRVIAPALGGIIVATAGIAAAIYVCSLGAMAMVFACAGLSFERVVRERKESVLKDLTEGLSYIRDNSLFAFLIGMTFFTSFFGQGPQNLMPVFARDIFELGPSGLGFLLSTMGVGSFLGILIVGYLGDFERKGLLIIGGGTAFGASLIFFAMSSYLPIALVALFCCGLFHQIFQVSLQSTLQLRVPDELRGRVMGVYGMTHQVGPLGAFQAGALADIVGAPVTVALGGAALIAFALGVASSSAQVRELQAAPVTGAAPAGRSH
jgi:MFS family permease